MSKKQFAFTLIELLVVIAIIGILSGLIVVSMSGVTQKANIAKYQVFSNSLRNALMLSLVADWKFDEGSGTNTVDSWGNKNGTFNNSPSWSTSCPSGSCVCFDGTANKYISTSLALNAPNYLTIEFWLKAVSDASYHWIIDGNQTMAGSIGIVRYVNDFQYRYANGTIPNGNSVFANFFQGYDNQWIHVIVSADYVNKVIKFYRNGIYLTTTVSMTTPIKPVTTYTNFGNYQTGSYPLIGCLDGVRIYSELVPAFQIKEQYYVGLNNLLINGGITKEEYLSRINNIANK